MHIVVDLNILDHILAIRLQATIEVVQVDPRKLPRRSIEEFRRQILRQLVVIALFLPSGHDVVAILANLPESRPGCPAGPHPS